MPLCCTAKTDISTRLTSKAVIGEDAEPLSMVFGTTSRETKPTA
jgi:hypothetical protein